MQLCTIIAFAILSVLLTTAPASAEKRVALVIGNGAYKNAPTLPNPKHDAEDVADALKRTGFETILGLDLDKAGMDDATIRFARSAREADVAIFYYSGHAMQFAGVNYLMPVDAKLADEADLRRMARVDEIVADVQQAKNLRILVLDSCRDNPLAEELKRSIGRTRAAAIQRGLAKIDSPQGMIIAYSTQAGRTAEDGRGRNSPFTSAFLQHIETPEEIGTIFRKVSQDVYQTTQRAQLPELSLSIIGEFYLKGQLNVTVTPTTPVAAGPGEAERAWALAKDSTSQAVLEDFIRRFGDSFYTTLAREKLEALKKSQVAVVAPPTPPLSANEPINIAIATGGTGGVYYPLGGGMANLLSKYVPGVTAYARVTGGSVDNLKLVGSQQSEVGMVMADAALDAFKGEDKFKGDPVDVRTLIMLYPNRMHLVTVASTGITKLTDLKGKRVSTGSPGSATEVMAFRMIEAGGLNKDMDIKRERLGVAESINAIKDRRIDAFFWVGGLPTAAITDLGAAPGVKMVLVDHDDVVGKMNAMYGGIYTAGVIPAKTYPGQDKDNKNTAVWNILVANSKMPDQVAFHIVRTIFEKRVELIAVHREAENITLGNQSPKLSPIPWHPGAMKFFSEKGVR